MKGDHDLNGEHTLLLLFWSWRCIGSEHDTFACGDSQSVQFRCLRAEVGFPVGKAHYRMPDALVVVVSVVAVVPEWSATAEQSHPRHGKDF